MKYTLKNKEIELSEEDKKIKIVDSGIWVLVWLVSILVMSSLVVSSNLSDINRMLQKKQNDYILSKTFSIDNNVITYGDNLFICENSWDVYNK